LYGGDYSSWLEFNQRVLDEALDDRVPLLERLKFLAITGSNLDEFFMVRVGGLQMLAAQGFTKRDGAGLTPAEQLQAITARAQRLVADQCACFLDDLEPGMAEAGIVRCGPDDLDPEQARMVQRLFETETVAIVTPMAVSAGEEFPLLGGLDLNVLVRLEADETTDGFDRYAVIPLGRSPSRLIALPSDGGLSYMLLEDMVGMFVERFFPGERVLECVPFRISRNAKLAVREDLAADLLSEMESLLDARKESGTVRLEIDAQTSSTARSFLQDVLDVVDDYVYEMSAPLGISAFMQLAGVEGFPELKDEPWPPCESPNVDPKASMFEILSEQDLVLAHPYESFDPVMRLVDEAADDPDVLAIKQTLYRTSRGSPVVAALKRAAQNGKYVTAVIELKARFDEARNIEWARELEKEGVQVIYGVRNLKVHAKALAIVRREPHGIRRYLHFGTGNYNEVTARLYTDISYMTTDDDLGTDATTFFNALTGYSELQRFEKLVIAPTALRTRILALIRTEEEEARSGREARIFAKMNSLLDREVVEALYSASQAGVEIRLVVRGICSLRPGVPGLSENIQVVSVVDRFLEHSRIFHFHHGGDRLVAIGSADWMKRNLSKRVETFVPIKDRAARERLLEMLEISFHDRAKGRHLMPDGRYVRADAAGSEEETGPQKVIPSQEKLYRMAMEALDAARQSRIASFEPHRSATSS
jgi:polyphosphate kinase